MEEYEKLDAILKFYYDKKLDSDLEKKIGYRNYGFNATDAEKTRLEHELHVEDYINIKGVSGGRVTYNIEPEGILFYEAGGYSKSYKLERLAKEKKERIEQEESDARKAAIKQGEYAEKAYNLSRWALWVSIGAALISLGAIVATIA